MTRTITLSEADHTWLKQELSFQIDMERSRLRFAAEKFHDQIHTDIERRVRLLGALADE